MELEVEAKLELDVEDPLGLLTDLLGRHVRRREQLNRYFLPVGPRGLVVRLREEEGGVLLTIKGAGRAAADGVLVKPEANEVIPPEWLLELRECGESEALFGAAIMKAVEPPLEYMGQSHNTRWSFDFRSWTVDLDRTVYPDGSVSWEVEIEAEDAGRARNELARTLDDAGIGWRSTSESKFSRVLKRR